MKKFQFLRRVNSSTSKESSYFDLIAVVLFYCILIATGIFVPTDDYWRHLSSHRYNYDYRQLYFSSTLPSFNLWIGFDVLLALLHQVFGMYSYIVIQIMSLLFYSLGYYFLVKDRISPSIALFFFGLFLCMLRIPIARPSVLLASLFFFLWCYDNKYLRITVPLLTAPFYWLFFICYLPLALKERKVLLSIGVGLIFWCIYGGSEYWHVIANVFLMSANRGEMLVYENLSIISVFISFHICSFVPLFLLFFYEKLTIKEIVKKDIKALLSIIFYSISNQIRYFSDFVAPLLYTYIRHLKKITISKSLAVFTGILPLLLWSIGTKQEIDFRSWGDFPELKGSKILVADILPAFPISYFVYPVKVVPSMEYGFTSKEVQDVVKEIRVKGKIDCSKIESIDADFIVESRTKFTEEEAKSTPCVHLYGSNGKYKIWRIVKEKVIN